MRGSPLIYTVSITRPRGARLSVLYVQFPISGYGRQAQAQQRWRLIEDIGRLMQPKEEAYVVETYEEEGTGRLRYSDFDPTLMGRPIVGGSA
jgi:hypothetical protein